MGTMGIMNARISCKNCGSKVHHLSKTDDRDLYKCKCQLFDMSQIDIFADVPPEEITIKIKKAFDALNWELEIIE